MNLACLTHSRLTRRGSVLVLVVALLVLLALVATAFLTTTRFDRQAAVQHVTNTQMEFAFEAGKKYLEAEVLSDILDPGALQAGQATTVRTPSSIVTPSAFRPIDASLADPFLAARTPFLQFTYKLTGGAANPIARPMWRTISWPTFSSAEMSLGIQYEPPDNNNLVQPTTPVNGVTPNIGPVDLVRPYDDAVAYKVGEVVMVAGDAPGQFDYYIRTPVSSGASGTKPIGGLLAYPGTTATALWEKCDPKQYFTFAPTTVTGTDGKTYPAFYVYNNYVSPFWANGSWTETKHARYVTGPVLAADADGDGVADSMYRRLPLGTLNGVTYYMAVRVVDNGSAINLNTAWAGVNINNPIVFAAGGNTAAAVGGVDADFSVGAPLTNNAWRVGTEPSYGFFPGNTGLREMLFSYNAPNQIGEPFSLYNNVSGNVNSVADLPTEYYSRDNGVFTPGYKVLREISTLNAFRFGYDPSNRTLPLGLTPSQDAANNTFSQRNDFSFRTQTEALFTLAAIRPTWPAKGDNGGGAGGAPDGSVNANDVQLRWLTLSGDGAALAYKGGALINLDVPPARIDQLFIDGVKDLGGSVDIMPEIDSIYASAANRHPLSTARDRSAFALAASRADGTNSEVDAWFDYCFNFDRYYEAANTRFVADIPNNGNAYFRSIRPLLVTSSAVSNVVGPRTTVAGRAEVPEQVTDVKFNPATQTNTAITQVLPVTIPGPGGLPYGIAPYSYVANAAVNEVQLNAAVGTFSLMTQYKEPGTAGAPVLTTTTAKVSANAASFGDLWRAYWNVMIDDWSIVTPPAAGNRQTFNQSGTPFEREITAYETTLPGALQGCLLNPYWGSRFNSSGLNANDFTPGNTATSLTATGLPTGFGFGQIPYVPSPADALAAIPAGSEIEYNPMRMFRSVIRSFVLSGAGAGAQATDFVPPMNGVGAVADPNAALPHFRPDQMMLLRSAIAAANAEDARDTDFKVTRRTIKLKLSGQTGVWNGAAFQPAPEQDVAVTINGYEPQPFITEVYVNTDTQQIRSSSGDGRANVDGYVAIELHNPYPFPIDIAKCKIATIRRFDPSEPGYPNVIVEDMENSGPNFINLANATSNLELGGVQAANYLPPTVIPANGYLVLESYDAQLRNGHRPDGAGLAGVAVGGSSDAPIDAAAVGPRANFAYVANLARVLNREFVLLRPLDVASPDNLQYSNPPFLAGSSAANGFVLKQMDAVVPNSNTEATQVRVLRYDDPDEDSDGGTGANFQQRRTRAVDMVPLDSFDFTGAAPSTSSTLPVEDPEANGVCYSAGSARAWHYVRANNRWGTNGQPGPATGPGAGAWRFVYPGRYDATKTTAGTGLAAIALPRQQGTQVTTFWADTGTDISDDPWQITNGPSPVPANLGRPDDTASYRYAFAAGSFQRGEFPIPLLERGSTPMGISPLPQNFPAPWAGLSYYPALLSNQSTAGFPTPSTPVVPYCLPFGGFARNGDLLEVPFIGSYRIQYPAHIGNDTGLPVVAAYPATTDVRVRDVVVELNSITMDAAMAEDTDVNTDPIVGPQVFNQRDNGAQSREQVGRFVPLRKTWLPRGPNVTTDNDPSPTATNEQPDYQSHVAWAPPGNGVIPVLYDDMTPNVANGASAGNYQYTSLNRYRWANDLFDYLTVQSAPDDYLPNIKPDMATASTAVQNTALSGTANAKEEVNVPREGLVNINTASERVLAMIPWCPDVPTPNSIPGDRFTFGIVPGVAGFLEVTAGADGVNDNLQMARAIVRFRDGFEARNPDYLQLLGSSDLYDGASQVGNYRAQPFLTMWDLYRVPEFRSLQALLLDPEPVVGNGTTATLRTFLDQRVGDITQYPYDFSLGFNGKFFGMGDRVRIAVAGGFAEYECIQSHRSDAGNAPPNNVYWRAATDGTTSWGLSGPRFDFEEQSWMLTRVSNLITTRSDVFTAYLLLEGWENAGTAKASMRVQRRAAFFLDRSQTTPGKIELKAPIPIPVD